MGRLHENRARSVLERAATQEAGTFEWWTALSFDGGDLALEPDRDETTKLEVEDLELRLYSL